MDTNKEKTDKNFKVETPEDVMKILKIIGMVILGIAACFGFGLVVKLLWNSLMPELFGLKEVTYWQGIGLLILSCLLFGRLGGGSGDSEHKKKKHGKSGIKEKIKEEIRKEIEKEFEKEDNKKASKEVNKEVDKEASEEVGKESDREEQQTNLDYDELYDKWWEKEGEKSFEKYSSSCCKDD